MFFTGTDKTQKRHFLQFIVVKTWKNQINGRYIWLPD